MRLHHCWWCLTANTGTGTTQTGRGVVPKTEPWLSLGMTMNYRTTVKTLCGMVKSHRRMFRSKEELRLSWGGSFYSCTRVWVESEDTEKQTVPAWQLTKILCIQVTAAERQVLLPNTVPTEKPWCFSPQRQAKHIKAFHNKAVEGEILNKNTKQAGLTDSATKVCGLLVPPWQWKLKTSWSNCIYERFQEVCLYITMSPDSRDTPEIILHSISMF